MLNIENAHKEATEVRLQLIKQDFIPLPTVGKKGFLKGWNKLKITDKSVRAWGPNSPYRPEPAVSTAIRIDDDLIAIDIDIDHPMAERIAAGIQKIIKMRHTHGIVDNQINTEITCRMTRTADGATSWKRAILVICPCEDPVTRIATNKYVHEGKKHCIEIFGSGRSQTLTIQGPHTQRMNDNSQWCVEREYHWKPYPLWDQAKESLPVMQRKDLELIIRRSDQLMSEAGFQKEVMKYQPRPSSQRSDTSGRGHSAEYIIPTKGTFQMLAGGEKVVDVGYDSLVMLTTHKRQIRISSSWLDGGTNPTRMAVHPADCPKRIKPQKPGIRIYDFESGKNFLPDIWEISGQQG